MRAFLTVGDQLTVSHPHDDAVVLPTGVRDVRASLTPPLWITGSRRRHEDRVYPCVMAETSSTPALLNSRLFHGMPKQDAQAILAAATHRALRKGQVLPRQGEPASTFFLMERGYLKLTQLTPEGAEVIVRFVGPWDPVAGVAALGETPYPVTAVACDAPYNSSRGRARSSPSCSAATPS
jgi:hypothetical protein